MTAANSRSSTWLLTAAVATLAVFEAGLAWNTHGLAQEGVRARNELVARITGFRETIINQVQTAHEQYTELRQEVGKAMEEAASPASLTRLEALGHAENRVHGLAARSARYENSVYEELAGLRAETAVLRSAADGLSMTLNDTRGEVAAAGLWSLVAAGHLERLGLLNQDTHRKLPSGDFGATARRFQLELSRQQPDAEFGGIRVALRRADPKQNRYRVELAANGRTIGLAERTLNEPLLFYTGGNRLPCELVVEEIGKDAIRGRLTVPAAPRTDEY